MLLSVQAAVVVVNNSNKTCYSPHRYLRRWREPPSMSFMFVTNSKVKKNLQRLQCFLEVYFSERIFFHLIQSMFHYSHSSIWQIYKTHLERLKDIGWGAQNTTLIEGRASFQPCGEILLQSRISRWESYEGPLVTEKLWKRGADSIYAILIHKTVISKKKHG